MSRNQMETSGFRCVKKRDATFLRFFVHFVHFLIQTLCTLPIVLFLEFDIINTSKEMR